MPRGWLLGLARRQGFGMELLEQAGLVGRADGDGAGPRAVPGPADLPDPRRPRADGRASAAGSCPGSNESMAEQGRHVAKYLNTPETTLFQKRTLLYGADLARAAARQAGWVAVVEGYTDVIAAHQVGLENVVGTLGTALGEDHIGGLRRLADRVVLVFDGDEAGQSAADRSLELFLGHEVDLRVLTLPAGLDPCDFLLQRGAAAFRELVERAPDPLAYLLDRAAARFDLDSVEGSRRAAEWVLGILNARPDEPSAGARGQDGQGPRRAVASGSACRWRRSTECSAGCGSSRARRRPAPAARTPAGGAARRPATPARPRPPRRPRSGWPSSTGPTWSSCRSLLNEPSRRRLAVAARRRLEPAGRPAAGDPPGLLRPPGRGATPRLREPHGPARGPGGPRPGDRPGRVDGPEHARAGAPVRGRAAGPLARAARAAC